MGDRFLAAGKEKGLQVFRIEDLAPVPVPQSKVGQFYTGDSYIVLHTKQEHAGGKLLHDVYFWQGAETSVDEKGASAILTKELDDALGGEPIQHREVQGSESPAFSQLFPGGVKYLQGGVASGFHHVADAAHKATLYKVEGTSLSQVATGRASLDPQHVFLLDLGAQVYVYAGAEASGFAKNRAMTATQTLRDDKDHAGKAVEVVHVEEGEADSAEAAAFFQHLGA